MSDDVMADHLKWLRSLQEEAFQRGLAKGREEVTSRMCDALRSKNIDIDALDARIRELEEVVELFRDAVQIDTMIEGPRVGGVSLKRLQKAWDASAALRAESPAGGER